MLEEAFNNATVSPAEAALALLSFVRCELPAGGSAAETRFLRLFPLVCRRVFGPLETKDGFRHEPGGWLSQQARWDRPSTSSPSSPAGRLTSSVHASKDRSLGNDPVVQLLAGRSVSSSTGEMLPTLIDAISAETEHRPGVRFPFPFQALPKPTQDVLLAMIERAYGGLPPDSSPPRDNAKRLCGDLLRVHPRDQNELRLYQQKMAGKKQEQQRPLQFSPGVVSSPVLPSSPKPPSQDLPPRIMLSMLEYYLITFVRYPLAAPLSRYPQPQGTPNSSTRVTEHVPRQSSASVYSSVYGTNRKSPTPYGMLIYDYLFRGYLKHFLPHGKGRSPFLGFSDLSRESELFLRILIEFWLDGQCVVPKTEDAAKAIRECRLRLGDATNSVVNLDASYDMIQIKNYFPPPAMVQTCIRCLVNHLVADPVVSLAVAESYESRRSSASQPSSSTLPARSEKWCLSPSMTALQQSFYNYVRTTFRHAPIHAPDSPFYTAMKAWLVWLEPWNVIVRKSKPSHAKDLFNSVSPGKRASQQAVVTSSIIIPKATSRSRFTQKWAPYIAANLYLYTVPFAIFIRRARELDFSPRYFHSSMKCVQRVFRIFSPPVVAIIESLLSREDSQLLAKHAEVLGEFSPSLLGGLSLSSCGQDMHTLSEEIYMQHLKTVQELDFFDRIVSRLESIFSQGPTSDEAAIKSLIGQAQKIVDFPVDFIQMNKKGPARGERSVSAEDRRVPERQPNGLITQQGREQVIAGAAITNVLELPYLNLGDKMLSPPKSYEIPFLVSWAIRLSNWLNEKLGLVVVGADGQDTLRGDRDTTSVLMKRFHEGEKAKKTWIRINLRFLADYRNIVFIVFVSWLVKILRA